MTKTTNKISVVLVSKKKQTYPFADEVILCDKAAEGVKQAKKDWVIVLNAGEKVEGAIRPLTESVAYDAYKFKTEKDNEVRLFRNKIGIDYSNLKESLKELNANVGTTKIEITKDKTPEVVEHYNKAITYYEKNNYSDAIREFLKANHLDHKNIEVHIYLGTAYFKQGAYDKALKVFTSALKVKPEEAKAFKQKNAYAIIMFSIGTVLHKQERFTKAITAYQKAIALNHPDKKMIKQRIKLAEKAKEEKVKLHYIIDVDI